MQILVVGLVKNNQLVRVQEEGQKRNHIVDGCYASDLIIKASTDRFEVLLKNGKKLDSYDLIYLWSVGKRRWDWYTAAEYLNKTKGTIVVNKKAIDSSYNYFLSSASDYAKQTENNLPYPKSAIIFSEKSVDLMGGDFDFPIIVKISEGRQGKGVFLVNSKAELKEKVKELLIENPSVILREFIPNDGDIRIFTVGYKAIGAMKRTPTKEGEFRSNISQGGTGEPYDLKNSPEVRVIAEKLSEITRTEVAGVDIMMDINTGKPYILEINPGPQFTGFEKYTGINAAGAIIKYFEKLLDESSRH
jgi:RimK family alpha-L-glutamate ligase